MSNENNMFDVAISGKVTFMNHVFTYPVRDPLTGLLHKSSCKRKYVESGKFLTCSFFPFDFNMVNKIKKHMSGIDQFRGKTAEQLDKEGYLMDPDFYDPTTTKWYNYWYGGDKDLKKGMPNVIKKNERLIPIYHEVCSKSDIFETSDGHDMGFKSYISKLLFTLYKNNKTKDLLTNVVTSAEMNFFDNMNKLYNSIHTDGILRYEIEKSNYRLNTALKHIKVLGGPKEETVVKFGDPIVGQLLMECTK